MASSKNLQDMQSRNGLPHIWRNSLMSTTTEDPLYQSREETIYFEHTTARAEMKLIHLADFSGDHCPNCAAYQLRGRALHGDWSRFSCCGGSMPCSGSCGESECPRFCAGVEALLCFQCSVATTRFMLQDELRLQNTKCDNCIIGTMFWLQYLNCICSIVACLTNSEIIDDASIITDRVADIAYCSVCACLQTQHKLQMDQRDGLLPPNPGTTIRAPPQQEMNKF